jgi:hypothetical protein
MVISLCNQFLADIAANVLATATPPVLGQNFKRRYRDLREKLQNTKPKFNKDKHANGTKSDGIPINQP